MPSTGEISREQTGISLGLVGLGDFGFQLAELFRKQPLVERIGLCDVERGRIACRREEYLCHADWPAGLVPYRRLCTVPAGMKGNQQDRIDRRGPYVLVPQRSHTDCEGRPEYTWLTCCRRTSPGWVLESGPFLRWKGLLGMGRQRGLPEQIVGRPPPHHCAPT